MIAEHVDQHAQDEKMGSSELFGVAQAAAKGLQQELEVLGLDGGERGVVAQHDEDLHAETVVPSGALQARHQRLENLGTEELLGELRGVVHADQDVHHFDRRLLQIVPQDRDRLAQNLLRLLLFLRLEGRLQTADLQLQKQILGVVRLDGLDGAHQHICT